MLERMGVEDAQSWSSGEVVELANLLAAVSGVTWEDVDTLRGLADEIEREERDVIRACPMTPEYILYLRIRSIADRIAALLPPEA